MDVQNVDSGGEPIAHHNIHFLGETKTQRSNINRSTIAEKKAGLERSQ